MNSPAAGRKSETQSTPPCEPWVKPPPLSASSASITQPNLTLEHHDKHSKKKAALNHHTLLQALEKSDIQQPKKLHQLCSMVAPSQRDSISLYDLSPTGSKNSLETVSITSTKEDASDTVIVDAPTHCSYIDRSLSSDSPVFIESSMDEKDPDQPLGWYLCWKPTSIEKDDDNLSAQAKRSFSQHSGLKPKAINKSPIDLRDEKKIIGTYISQKGFAGEILDDYY